MQKRVSPTKPLFHHFLRVSTRWPEVPCFLSPYFDETPQLKDSASERWPRHRCSISNQLASEAAWRILVELSSKELLEGSSNAEDGSFYKAISNSPIRRPQASLLQLLNGGSMLPTGGSDTEDGDLQLHSNMADPGSSYRRHQEDSRLAYGSFKNGGIKEMKGGLKSNFITIPATSSLLQLQGCF